MIREPTLRLYSTFRFLRTNTSFADYVTPMLDEYDACVRQGQAPCMASTALMSGLYDDAIEPWAVNFGATSICVISNVSLVLLMLCTQFDMFVSAGYMSIVKNRT